MYQEDDFLSISALNHIVYCIRRAALVCIEALWEENMFTADGRDKHEHVHSGGHENRDGIRYEYSVTLRSFRLGLIGKADVVEFRHLIPYPVEHKRGKTKQNDCDRIQLCAQAMCLEEMLNCNIPEGSLFYGKTRSRELVSFTQKLRIATEQAALNLHLLFDSGITPPPVYIPEKCDSCSIINLCNPKLEKKRGLVESYLERALK